MPSLHDYDVKVPNFKFCDGTWTQDNYFLFLFLNLDKVSKFYMSSPGFFCSYQRNIFVGYEYIISESTVSKTACGCNFVLQGKSGANEQLIKMRGYYLLNTVEPPLTAASSSPTATFFGGQSIHTLTDFLKLLLYKGRFLLSPRWQMHVERFNCTQGG